MPRGFAPKVPSGFRVLFFGKRGFARPHLARRFAIVDKATGEVVAGGLFPSSIGRSGAAKWEYALSFVPPHVQEPEDDIERPEDEIEVKADTELQKELKRRFEREVEPEREWEPRDEPEVKKPKATTRTYLFGKKGFAKPEHATRYVVKDIKTGKVVAEGEIPKTLPRRRAARSGYVEREARAIEIARRTAEEKRKAKERERSRKRRREAGIEPRPMRKLTAKEKVAPAPPPVDLTDIREKWVISKREEAQLYIQKHLFDFKKNIPVTIGNKEAALQSVKERVTDEFLRIWESSAGTEQKFIIRMWSNRYVKGLGKIPHGYSTAREEVTSREGLGWTIDALFEDFSKSMKGYLKEKVMGSAQTGYFIEGFSIENIIDRD